MNTPLVSIVIPIYKVERFLPACIDSVLAQSYTNLEILLVDDGSPDNCPRICDAYAAKDARIRVIHQQNGGLSRARNAGLAATTGKYVYFLDSDDLLVDEAIGLLVQRAEETESDIVFFESLLISEDGSAHPDQDAHRRKHDYDTPMRGADMLARLVSNEEFMAPVPYLFLRRDFMQNRSFEPDLLYEDVLFSFFAFLDAARTVGLNLPLYRYRVRGGSIMTGGASRKHFSSLLAIYRAIEARLTDADDTVKAAILPELATLQQAEVHLYHRLSAADRKHAAEAHRGFLRGIAASDYAKAAPQLFAVNERKIQLIQLSHRLLSPQLRAKIKKLLHK